MIFGGKSRKRKHSRRGKRSRRAGAPLPDAPHPAVAASNVVSGNIDLTDYEMDMSCGGTTKNAISFSYSASIDSSGQITTFSSSDKFIFAVDITNISIEYVEGYLGQFQFEVEKDSMDVGFYQNI